ncbi:hypothetical protein [Colwellia psychrerythraea]|uniref:Uncharacterized protein n=1 Tax=Colwellia psychrerythraea TaxID=28229 RepID=A0A099KBS4_COLPS|nr:hypothetical protein [Colwellia psychrerythraea]KGJ87811.1 hypothetical protein GAB14E_4489 [Colwellia psychrerythraea]
MEFILEYWFTLIIVTTILVIIWKSGLQNSEGENKTISILLTALVFIPPWLLTAEEPVPTVIYAVSLGCICLLAYFKTSMCIFFEGLVGVSNTFFYPPSKKWLLALGGILVSVPPIQYYMGLL